MGHKQNHNPMAAHCKYVRSYQHVFSCCLVPNWSKMRNVTINRSLSFRSNQPPKRNSIAKPNKHEKTYWNIHTTHNIQPICSICYVISSMHIQHKDLSLGPLKVG